MTMSHNRSDFDPDMPAAEDGSPAERPAACADEVEAVVERFEQDLLIRGEAAPVVDGQLPPGVTHEIVGTDARGQPVVRRRRFSAT